PSDTWGDAVPRAFANCMNRYKADGVRLLGYGILERVADLEQALVTNGLTRVHLVADGFGSITALTFARLHPEQVDRIVLLAPTPADQPVGSSKDSARVLNAYDASAEAAVRDTNLPARWMMYAIDRDRVRMATALQLAYRRGALASVGAWRDAARGDFAGIGQISWGADVVLGSSFVWGEVVPALASLDPSGVDMVDGDPVLPSATLVTALGGLGLVSLAVPEFPALPTAPVDKPVLVIHGELDPRYSPETTVAAMQRELAHPVFARIAGYGSPSELWAVAPGLLANTITTFLDGGAAPSDLAPPLSPEGMSLATMAKLTVTAMAAFPVAGALLVLLLLRRTRRTMKRDAARQ
ncbi:MAG TPA: alpha/beta hydrolase, partial [Myxococcota bacterium]|nr:alpha/beta hydrolase [Myxococcota bacterium]